MKKLLSTTAIAGLLISGSAFAQTTITGEMRINYKGVSQDIATGTTPASGRGFGTEQQINFANKGKLNVGGLDYAAGFSIENDGAQVGTLFNENMYIDLTNASSGTTLSFSQDHIQRSDSDRSAAVIFGFSPNELSSGGNTTLFDQTAGVGTGASQSVAILQKVGTFGTLSYNYAPTTTDQVSTTTTSGVGNSENFAETGEESSYEVGFTGSLGVAGLDVAAFKSKQKAMFNATTGLHNSVKPESDHFGIRYTTGAVSFGAAQKKYNQEAAATKIETKEKHYGVAYAVDKNLSLGIVHATAEQTLLVDKQKTTGIQVGYNLGPVALVTSVAKSADVGGVEGADNKVFMSRLIGAF
jgi:hypothetical protein